MSAALRAALERLVAAVDGFELEIPGDEAILALEFARETLKAPEVRTPSPADLHSIGSTLGLVAQDMRSRGRAEEMAGDDLLELARKLRETYRLAMGGQPVQAAPEVARLELPEEPPDVEVPPWYRGDDFHTWRDGYGSGWRDARQALQQLAPAAPGPNPPVEPRGCPIPGACACPAGPIVPPELIAALKNVEVCLLAGPVKSRSIEHLRALLILRSALQRWESTVPPANETDRILHLAAIIREVDGGNRLGAAGLAEALLNHPDTRKAFQ